MNIAITGGIGAGKSTLLSALKQSFVAAQFASIDDFVDELYDTQIWQTWLRQEFGTSDRVQISLMAFSDPSVRAKLQAHSDFNIGVRLGRLLGQHNLLFVEIPLLFESGLQDQFDHTVVVTADAGVRIQRVVARGKKTAVQVEAVVAAQMPETEKIALADVVIDTTHSCPIEDGARLVAVITALLQQGKNEDLDPYGSRN